MQEMPASSRVDVPSSLSPSPPVSGFKLCGQDVVLCFFMQVKMCSNIGDFEEDAVTYSEHIRKNPQLDNSKY